MKITVLVLSLSTILSGLSFAQDSGDNSPEKAAIAANDRAYEAAYAKSDVQALADFFAEDAQYTTDDGRTFDGRAAIQQSMTESFATGKGDTLKINLDSVRVLSPDVVMEKGSTR